MKLIGHVVGILTDINTGEKTVAFDETNHLQDGFIESQCQSWDGTYIKSDIAIWASGNPQTQRRDYLTNPVPATFGQAIAGVTSPEYTYNDPVDNVHVKQLAKRFPAPAADITIWTIAVTSTALSTSQVQAAVTLTVPCVQTTTQTLDVYYRIQVPYSADYWNSNPAYDSTDATPEELERWAIYFLSGSTHPVQSTSRFCNWADHMNPRIAKTGLGKITTFSPTQVEAASDVRYFKANFLSSFEINDEVGRFIAHSAYDNPNNNYNMHLSHILKDHPNESPIQNIYGHSAGALTPFYDSATSQGGLGTLVINGDSWTNPDYPKFLRLNIGTTGGLGVSNYNFQIRNAFHFESNTYQNQTQEVVGYHYYNDHMVDGFKIFKGSKNDGATTADVKTKSATIAKKDHKTIVAAWGGEVLISDVPSQSGKRFASDTVPAMSAVDITQFSSDPVTGDVYVACRTNGLFKISNDQTTVTRIYNATTGLTGTGGCYGTAVAADGRVWAFFGGTNYGLYYSDDNGATWTSTTFSHTVIDSDPDRVKQIHIDPSHANDHIALVYGDNIVSNVDADLMIAWWDLAGVIAVGGAAVQGPKLATISNENDPTTIVSSRGTFWINYRFPITYMPLLTCSPNDGAWLSILPLSSTSNAGAVPAFYTFGTLTISQHAVTDVDARQAMNGGWGVDENLNDAYFYLTYSGQDKSTGWAGFGGTTAILRQDLTVDVAYTEANRQNVYNTYDMPSIYMGAGTFLLMNYPDGTDPAPNNKAGGFFILSAIPFNPAYETSPGAMDNEFFPTYGWNGSAWEKHHAGLKLTHAAAEEVIDGITVSFDDVGATEQFEATDFYTTCVFNGIVTDGSTTFEQRLSRYQKPSFNDTVFEASVLPASTRVPPYFEEFIPQAIGDWQDVTGLSNFSVGSVDKPNSANIDLWNLGCRSLLPAVRGTVSNLSSQHRMPQNDVTGVQGYAEFRLYPSTDTYQSQQQVGLSNASVLGTPIDKTTMQYAIEIDSLAATVTGARKFRIRILESGVVKATLNDRVIDGPYLTNDRARIIILADGSVLYEMATQSHSWERLHLSPPGTATIENLYLDVIIGGQLGGIKDIKTYSHVASSDHYLFIGNGIDTGLFDSTFRVLDPTTVELTIDSLPTAQVGVADATTPLSAGEYSVFPEGGCIRYSASDVGKSITGKYTYVSDES